MQNPSEVWNALLKQEWTFDLSVAEDFITHDIDLCLDVDLTDEIRSFLNGPDDERVNWFVMDEFIEDSECIADHDLCDSILSIFFKDAIQLSRFVTKHNLKLEVGRHEHAEDLIVRAIQVRNIMSYARQRCVQAAASDDDKNKKTFWSA